MVLPVTNLSCRKSQTKNQRYSNHGPYYRPCLTPHPALIPKLFGIFFYYLEKRFKIFQIAHLQAQRVDVERLFEILDEQMLMHEHRHF